MASQAAMQGLGEGNVRVSLRSVEVQGSLSQDAAVSALKEALRFLQQSLSDTVSKGSSAAGVFALDFRVEPSGQVQTILDKPIRLEGDGAEEVIEQFIAAAINQKWRFPPSRTVSLVEAEFEIGTAQQ